MGLIHVGSKRGELLKCPGATVYATGGVEVWVVGMIVEDVPQVTC